MTESEAVKELRNIPFAIDGNENVIHLYLTRSFNEARALAIEALEMRDKINQEKQVMLEDIREAIIDKLEEQLKDTRLASATGAFNECFFESQSYLQGVEDTYIKAIKIVKEAMKDGEI